jgi:ribonuclease Z
VSPREVVVLGTASQVPTRHRNHNGYLLRWDGLGILFDPGEGTQRQMTLAGVAASDITHICLSHFHGDHCLGLPGVLQRLSLDQVTHLVHAAYPADGQQFFTHLRYACSYHDTLNLVELPVAVDGPVLAGDFGVLEAHRLDHGITSYGYRLVEPDGLRMLPDRLAAAGVSGPRIGELQRAGQITVDGRTVRLSEVSAPRRGQRVAFVMDTRLCDAVYTLADQADLLIIEATFRDGDEPLADRYGHLTARQAARVAAECGVRTLVLTHFSQRYPDPDGYRTEAAEVFDGHIVVAADLDRVPVPRRRI